MTWQLNIDDDITGMTDEMVVMVTRKLLGQFPSSIFTMVNEATDHSHFFQNRQITVRRTLSNTLAVEKKFRESAWPGI